MAKDEAKSLRRVLENSRDGRGRMRPKRELKRQVAKYAAAMHERGEQLPAIAQRLGMKVMTLRRWLMASSDGGRLKQVQVVGPVSQGAVVHGPRGMRIEGLSVAELAELWLRLG